MAFSPVHSQPGIWARMAPRLFELHVPSRRQMSFGGGRGAACDSCGRQRHGLVTTFFAIPHSHMSMNPPKGTVISDGCVPK